MYMFVFLEDIVYAWLWKKLKMKVSEKKLKGQQKLKRTTIERTKIERF